MPSDNAIPFLKLNSRISFFLPSLRGGGAERVMLNVASGLAEKGYAVDLVLANKVGKYLDKVPVNIRLIDLQSDRALKSIPSLVRYLRQSKPSVLLPSLPHVSLAALIAKRIACTNTRLIIVEHNTLSETVKNATSIKDKSLPFFMRLLYRQSDRIVAVSIGVADDLAKMLKLPKDNIDVIYNPVVTSDLHTLSLEHCDHLWFSENSPPVILGIGRLTPAKGFSSLIRAFAIIRKVLPARLVLLGEGDERPALERLVRDLELSADVALPGFVDNPYCFLRQASVFVLSSLWEGLPTALIEALACGTPVVSTDCPSGPREILHDGHWGTLVPVNDDIALAGAIRKTLINRKLKGSNESWARYTSDYAISQYIDLFNNL